MSDSVEITPGAGVGVAAKPDESGNYVQVVTDPALSGGVLEQILAELVRLRYVLCAIGRLSPKDFEDIGKTQQ